MLSQQVEEAPRRTQGPSLWPGAGALDWVGARNGGDLCVAASTEVTQEGRSTGLVVLPAGE